MMHLKKSLMAIAAFLIMTPAFGQVEPVLEDMTYIEVTGIAEDEIVPDEIYVSLDIREHKSANSFTEQEEKLKAVISDLGISLSDLQLSDAITDYVKVQFKSGNIKMGKNYTLKVKDAATLGKLFYRLDKEDIAEASIERLDHSQMDSLKKAIRIKAIKAARDKAEYLLTAIGQKLGKPLLIREQEIAPNWRQPYAANSTADTYAYKGKQQIEFERIKIQSSIYIKFAIK